MSAQETPTAGRAAGVSVLMVLLAAWTGFGQTAGTDSSESDETPPETITITADAPQRVSRPGVHVLDVDEATEAGHTTVAEAVDALPGVTIQRRGSGFEPSTVRIRGSTAEQVLVLRDGQPTGGTTGTTDLSRIALDGIERIEVILGPATALYGGGGAAGAINLLTGDGGAAGDAPPNVSGRAAAEYGSFGRYGIGGEATVTLAQTEIALSADGTYSRNRYDYTAGGSDESRENAGGLIGSLELGVTHTLRTGRLEIDGGVDYADRGVPGSVEFPSESATLTDSSASLGVAYGKPAAIGATKEGSAGAATDGWGGAIRVHAMREERHFEDPDYPLGALSSDALLRSIRGGVTARGPLAGVEVTVPLTSSFEQLTESELGNRGRWRLSAAPRMESPQLDLLVGSLQGQLAGRIELVGGGSASAEDGSEGGDASEAGGSAGASGGAAGWLSGTRYLPSVRGSATWQALGGRFEGSLAAAAGYRLPTYAELFWPGGAFAVGNPGLEPERSSSVELELGFGRPGEPRLRLNGFATWYRQLIQWLPDPTGYWRPRNTGRAVTYGAELAYGADLPLGLSPWSIEGDLTGEWLFARDRNEGPTFEKQLPYRPEYSASVSAALRHLVGHRLGVDIRGVGARPVTRQNTRWLDPYVAVDLSGAVAIPGTSVLVRGRVNNLLDQRFVETRFFPNPGREIVVSTEVTW